MARIKFTKNELKRQKDSLTRFKRYLPTLMLKKQQLQMEIRKINQTLDEKAKAQENLKKNMDSWIAVFGEKIDFSQFLKVKDIQTDKGNIAGIEIPIFKNIELEILEYDLFKIPLWVDKALISLQQLLSLEAEIKILRTQKQLLNDELRLTSQRVNLFEKVKIPEAQNHIRTIKIYLGDQQTAAVVRGKISKNKIEKAS
ncbi:MAG: V-type ATP synthase subunit D [Spirochaetales bacterium]|nr:V-type ATP synthase subunit D [Spirochaetales bacterium]